MISIDTAANSLKDNYKLLIGSVIPRPIAVVSTRNENGSNNLAPFSFFMGVCPMPLTLAFSPVTRASDGEKKDTLKNIQREKECVINFCTESNFEKVNLASTELPFGEDEFEYSGLTPIDSEVIQAKRLQESPLQFECKLLDIHTYGEGPGSGNLVVVQALKVHVDEKLYHEGRIDTSLFAPIGRGAGNDWIKTDNRIQVERLLKAQIQK